MPSRTERLALVIGASRGLGLVLAGELAKRGWNVIATARRDGGELEQLATTQDRIETETLDMNEPDQLAALHGRLADRRLDLLFVNAGIDRGNHPITEVSTEDFTDVMVTNALSPLRTLEALRDLVAPGGTVAVMSSRQGSVSNNTSPGFELYKASKAALNQLMRSYATRHEDDGQTKLLIHPGHNQTGLGGPGAPLTAEETMPAVADVLESQAGAPGLQFLDRFGEPVAW